MELSPYTKNQIALRRMALVREEQCGYERSIGGVGEGIKCTLPKGHQEEHSNEGFNPPGPWRI